MALFPLLPKKYRPTVRQFVLIVGVALLVATFYMTKG
jgi:hypothetical protein